MREQKKGQLDLLTKALEEADAEHGLEDYASGKKKPELLPERGETGESVPKADELVAAEKTAKAAEVEEQRAKREMGRLAEAKSDDDEEEEKARLEKLAAAKEKQEDARARKDAAEAAKKSLQAAMSRTRDGFVGRLGKALKGREIDDSLLDELEAILFTADIGVRTAERLLEVVKKKLKAKELTDGDKVTETLKNEIIAILESVPNPPLKIDDDGLSVVMVVGVNGAGKTTSIGKLTHQLQAEGHKVMLGAGDTFRAAAVEQLAVWADRNDAPIVRGQEGADPASVLFDAVTQAKKQEFHVVLCDTAGRLHTKMNLMEELGKVHRVIGKAHQGAPHEVILVLDATVGQNAIAQAKQFHEAVPLTGIILTKLDGTAKGGVVIGIADELRVPVRYIGVGEKIVDLRRFDAQEFVAALFGEFEMTGGNKAA
ncbi:MAG: signal recognition particle-docking protein FtsY [Deltaproteobacteria bacterium]|nr:signal recognition particle-docking protein FtsY [Deltaproteobacteria bacterium]